ncbi:lytic transglycosylase domain-containing protein [Dissulfurimicrobium hydrothermale]|uniref:lytic transglycosylase domain-containing protein n=1 Tax=Dissulfurimicrobium hydrothermale TaxID=1750598 RepID=UPI001EDBD438|nr:lytic transglycosylase domain-containing protein [Dissulfurimicrobium hydrothermale]UKL13541.1 lytic transglycosylase domain-containing protein [Dissulfurimicrobium hydrothermale]
MKMFIKKLASLLFYCFLISGCAASVQEKAPDYATPAINPVNPGPAFETPKETAVAMQKGPDLTEKGYSKIQGRAVEDPKELLDSSMHFFREAQEKWKQGGSEEALDLLDKAYIAAAKVDTGGDKGLEKKKEDMRLMISKKIQEINASKCKTINGSNCAIPITMNEDVQREINLLLGPQRKWFIRAYKRSGKFREEIVKACKEAGLPEELSWLPLIESGFNARAVSRAHAAGLWQLIPSTGTKFGLKRDEWIDERMDPEKSTQAAITYLKSLHDMFGDWTTALAAYNCGEGTVAKTIREQKISYLDNFWDLYKRLPKESASFVPRFLAVLELVKHPEKYNLDLNEPDEPLPTEEVLLDKQVHLKSLAEKLGVYYKELVELNPELRRDVTPDTTFKLKVPYGKADELLAEISDIQRWSPPPDPPRPSHAKKTKGRRLERGRKGEKKAGAGLKVYYASSKYKKNKAAAVKHERRREAAVVRKHMQRRGHKAGTAVVERVHHEGVKSLKEAKVVKREKISARGNRQDKGHAQGYRHVYKNPRGDRNEKKSSHALDNKGRHATKKDS